MTMTWAHNNHTRERLLGHGGVSAHKLLTHKSLSCHYMYMAIHIHTYNINDSLLHIKFISNHTVTHSSNVDQKYYGQDNSLKT